YAGLRPQRVARLAMLDFLGLKPPAGEDAAERLLGWLDVQTEAPRMRTYPDHAAFARRLRTANPRLTAGRADFLARHAGRVQDDGQVMLACDPWHKVPSPYLYRAEDAMAAWRRIVAPVLMLEAGDGFVSERFDADAEEYRRHL